MSGIPHPSRLIIATRESPLALYQANHVAALVRELYAACAVQLLGMTTRGDQILDRSLSAIGGKGLFIKELEQAIENGSADLAVHSLKDVPMELPEGFVLAAILAREDAHDALVSNRYQALGDLPPGAIVGTSSLRREAALHAAFPHLTIKPLRGNVGTRLRKLDEGEYDAIILAAAGLKRLGLAQRIRATLPIEESVPAVGQGALAIEIHASRTELLDWLRPLADADTTDCTRAERAFSRGLSGSCHTPLAAHAVLRDERIWLRGFLANPDGTKVLRGEASGSRANPEEVGATLADDFKARGAVELLAGLPQ